MSVHALLPSYSSISSLPFINQAAKPHSQSTIFKVRPPNLILTVTEYTLHCTSYHLPASIKPMPPLTQTSHLCPICSQRFYDILEVEKHYNSSHGNETDFPKNREGDDSEHNTGWDSDDAFYWVLA
ncbi:hypothetical protein NA56DRAFT_446032 [Hyaloscypha hepaticicola]|uniref:C2H2-type domain-containing protein n=1 Tax=Hyaloscypha hepaticicola TaxID=2082293 RepID=A0A2J6PG34_9HELO|nr:hypothetical protein NA56DRAFT_446032 [Hyaloscypha hepaticicola]